MAFAEELRLAEEGPEEELPVLDPLPPLDAQQVDRPEERAHVG